jgi:AAA+ ATPase superfamily predicted ATPase
MYMTNSRNRFKLYQHKHLILKTEVKSIIDSYLKPINHDTRHGIFLDNYW